MEVDGRSIGVFNVAGDYLAIRNRCPHQAGPLCEGVQVGVLTSDLPGGHLEQSPPRPGLQPGPYTAETVPVTVEGAYVVLELA